MYAPKQFREERRDVLLATIRSIQFASIIIQETGRFSAAHVPVLVRTEGGTERLEMHVARANPLWGEVGDECSALAIIQGPQAYVHPGWLETKKETGKAVPTWNYVAVHVHGRLKVVEDHTWLLRHLERLTSLNEQDRANPWTLEDAPEGYIQALMRGIVGLELEIERLEGAWKMIQHHPERNRAGVLAGLEASGEPGNIAVAGIMRSIEAERGVGQHHE